MKLITCCDVIYPGNTVTKNIYSIGNLYWKLSCCLQKQRINKYVFIITKADFIVMGGVYTEMMEMKIDV